MQTWKYTCSSCSISQIHWKKACSQRCPSEWRVFPGLFRSLFRRSRTSKPYLKLTTVYQQKYEYNTIYNYIHYIHTVSVQCNRMPLTSSGPHVSLQCHPPFLTCRLLLTQTLSQGTTATLALHESAPRPSLEEPGDVRDILTKCPRSQTNRVKVIMVCELSTILARPISYYFITYTGQSLSKLVLSKELFKGHWTIRTETHT